MIHILQENSRLLVLIGIAGVLFFFKDQLKEKLYSKHEDKDQ